jgi:hypothetical protein
MQGSGATRRWTTPAAGLLAVVVVVVLGGDFFGLRTRLFGQEAPEPATPATSEQADAGASPEASATPTRVRSQPWWQQVKTLEGEGAATAEVSVDDRALQWRVGWQCEAGTLTVEASGRDDAVVDAECPGEGTGYVTGTGAATLDIQATGAWQLEVAQQIDVPLQQAPTEAMQAPEAQQVARGSFYDIDQTGRGEVVIYQLADGSYALRLVEFFVTPNVDLEIRLSSQPRPETTEGFDKPASAYVETLRATTGSMNFAIPDDIDPTKHQSVVIWCPPVQNAYAAASLEWSQ